jgi:hypothetical protein
MRAHKHPHQRRLCSDDNNMTRFAKGVSHYRSALALARHNAIHLGATEHGAPLYLPQELLRTHVMIQAPTGHGKTYLARILFRSLATSGAAVYVDDPKHDFLEALEQDCAALHLDERVTIFDTSSPERTLLFNPLKKNGIRVEDQAQWLLSAIRSCFRQDSFDLTPQRPRWMANALIPVIEGEGTFDDVLSMLNFQEGAVRRAFVAETTNALVRKEWLAFEELSMTRRRDETYSAFCLSETLRCIFTPSPYSFDFAEFLKGSGILLQSFPRFRPLDEDATEFLRSLSLYSVLAQAFHIPPDERPPLVIILDEAEHALVRDSGVIATILREGRGLNIHLVLLFHEFAEVAAHNPGLLETVLNGCRTKFIGGHLTQSNLEVLTSELFTTEWHPHIVRNELYALETEPIETTRTQRSVSKALSRGRALSLPESASDGTSSSLSHGTNESTTMGTQESHSKAHTQGQSNGITQAHGTSTTNMETWAVTKAQGEHWAESSGMSLGQNTAAGQGMVVLSDGQMMTTTAHESAGASEAFTLNSSTGGSGMRALSQGGARAESVSNMTSTSATTSKSETEGTTLGQSVAHQQGSSESATSGKTETRSRGRTPSWSESVSESVSETTVPFHELRKQFRVASREFLSVQDFLTTKLIKLKGLIQAHWVVQPPEGSACFFKALYVKPLYMSKDRLRDFYAHVLGCPSYSASARELSAYKSTSPLMIEVQAISFIPEVLPPLVADDEASHVEEDHDDFFF